MGKFVDEDDRNFATLFFFAAVSFFFIGCFVTLYLTMLYIFPSVAKLVFISTIVPILYGLNLSQLTGLRLVAMMILTSSGLFSVLQLFFDEIKL